MNEKVKEPEHKISLPVVVVADDVHKRYCAYLLTDGKPDRRFGYGECRIIEGWASMEQQKQYAVDDLRNKIFLKLREAASQ